MKALRLLKAKWKGILIVVLLLNLLINTGIPALAEAIRVQAQPALNDISDVNAAAPADNDVLSWDDGASEWISEASAGGLWEVDGSDTQLITLDDIDFEKYKAIAMVCDNGATAPAAPTAGQWFLHTPTGRNVLLQHDGSNWIPIISLGTMTMYVNVDGATAGDAIDKGTTSANGFVTIQYAVDQIPGQVGGSVTIYIDDGEAAANTYAETVTIRGKSATGAYGISLYGNLLTLTSGTQSANGVQGATSTQGSFTDTGNLHATDYDNKLCYLDADGAYRLIDDADVNTATIAGTFPSQPLSGENYVIYDWGTVVNQIYVFDGKIGVGIYDVEIAGSGTYAMQVRYGATCTLNRCKVTAVCLVQNYGTLSLYYGCYLTVSGSMAPLYAQFNGTLAYLAYGNKICNSHSSGNCIYANNANVYLQYGSIIDGEAGGADDANGIYLTNNAACTLSNSASAGYVRFRNCDTGIYATQGAQVVGTTNTVYEVTVDTPEDNNTGGDDHGYID